MNWPFLTPGLDATGLPSPATNAEIQQMWQEGGPSTSAGMIVWAAAAPDVVTYPGIALCIWGKTSAGIPTGEFYTYNGTAWTAMKVVPGSITGDSFADGSIAIAKLTPGTALYVPRTNAAGNGVEWVSVATLIPNNTITPTMLQNAADTGYILRSGTGGVFAPVLFATAISEADIEISQVTDVFDAAAPNQVAYFAATGGSMGVGFVESLLRDNMIPTGKLQFSGSLAGKWVKVNASGTNFEGSSAAFEVALFSDTGASNTAPQSVLAATLTTLRLAAEGTLPSWASVNANQITLTPGTYLVEAFVPIYETTGTVVGYVGLYDATPTLIKNVTVRMTGDQDMIVAPLIVRLTVATTAAYTIKGYLDKAWTVGDRANIASIPEVYTQVKITRL